MNKQNKMIVGVVALILALTIGYAIFTQSLNISGTAKAGADFGLIFEKSANDPTCRGYSGGDDCHMDDVAEIIEDGKTLKITIDKLLYPTAYVKIPVLIKNTGTVDAVLKSMEIKDLESNDIDVKYSITEQDIKDGYVVKPGDDNRKEVEVEISWNKDSTNNGPIEVNFNITMNYEQASNAVVTTSSSSDNSCTEFAKKDTYEVGDVIAFCNTNTGKSEDFYVIKDNGDTVTALAKYNLMVGNKVVYDDSFENVLSNIALTSSDEDYGLQSKDTIFELTSEGMPASTTLNGVMAFANKDGNNMLTNCDGDGCYLGYWTNNENEELKKPLETYGTSYPADVYKENENKSLLSEPLKNYQSYFINTLNKATTKIRLITYNELIELGCSADENKCTKDFIYKNLNYWSATAGDRSNVWNVNSFNNFSGNNFWYDGSYGVRPVVTINKSEI